MSDVALLSARSFVFFLKPYFTTHNSCINQIYSAVFSPLTLLIYTFLHYINTLNAYAYNKEYSDAIPVYLKSLAIQETVSEKDILTYMQTLRLLANAYYAEKQFGAFEQAIKDCNVFQKKLHYITITFLKK